MSNLCTNDNQRSSNYVSPVVCLSLKYLVTEMEWGKNSWSFWRCARVGNLHPWSRDVLLFIFCHCNRSRTESDFFEIINLALKRRPMCSNSLKHELAFHQLHVLASRACAAVFSRCWGELSFFLVWEIKKEISHLLCEK